MCTLYMQCQKSLFLEAQKLVFGWSDGHAL